jgi:hypothetical protein
LVWAVCSYLCYSCFKWVNPENAHIAARNVADTGRLTWVISVGFNKVTNEASVLTGSKLVDNSRIYHSDANYNFRDLIKFAEIQVGFFRQYQLNFGRIYTDKDGHITTSMVHIPVNKNSWTID